MIEKNTIPIMEAIPRTKKMTNRRMYVADIFEFLLTSYLMLFRLVIVIDGQRSSALNPLLYHLLSRNLVF